MSTLLGAPVDDLATLNSLDESIILNEIARRYNNDTIYTYIGDILIAVNPYKPLPIYTFEISSSYANLTYRQALPPHIFAVADKAYSSMKRIGKGQCCVISGESGAGKTETAKYIIGHIISHCSSHKANLQERILQVNPLLEAFGNASTLMNDNSSRFGKFVDLKFNHDGQIVGANIDQYLLEKSRVVCPGPGEKNFHIFYYIFAGLTEQQLLNLLLSPPEKHRILMNADGRPVYQSESEFIYYQKMFDDLQDIMELVGFTQENILMIYTMLSAVIQICDIQFDFDTETGGSFIVDEYVLKVVSNLLGTDPVEFATALVSNIAYARGEQILSLKTPAQARDGCDALAKALYSKLFYWIVRQANNLVAPTNQEECAEGHDVGILDIYGFENFQHNSFEQLCINVTNEQLQYFFNQRIFAWELSEYSQEGVPRAAINFQDNQPVLDLFLKPVGIFSLLDEESKFPKASDLSFVNKVISNQGKHPNFLIEKKAKGKTTIFGIHHFAGTITYDATKFLEKNRDTFSANLADCMHQSNTDLVRYLFQYEEERKPSLDATPRSQKDILACKPPKITYDNTVSLSRNASRRVKNQIKDGKGHIKDNRKRKQVKTVSAAFKVSLTDLMEKMLGAEPQFIRCVKPNNQSRHSYMEGPIVQKQLKYTGVMETIRIRQQGFPTRLRYEDFLQRYKLISFPLTDKVRVNASNCKKILQACELSEYQLGKTKVFLKYWHAEKLNTRLDHMLKQIVTCQSVIRGRKEREGYKIIRQRAWQQSQLAAEFLGSLESFSLVLTRTLAKMDQHDKERHEAKKRQMLYGELRAKTDARQKLITQQEVKKRVPPPTMPKRFSYGEGNNVGQATTERSQIPIKKSLIEEEILASLEHELPRLDNQAWVKVYFMEKKCRLMDFNIKSPSVVIDGYKFQYPGRLGFGALNNPLRDEQTTRIRQHIGKGVQLEVDKEGSVWATKLGKNEVFVKGAFEPEKHCLSAEVIDSMGHLDQNQPMKIFDIKEYKVQLALESSKTDADKIDVQRLKHLSVVSLSFVKDAVNDFETPCWICIVVLPALRQDPKVVADAEKLLQVYRTAGEIERSNMGRTASRKWAKKHQRRSNYEKENEKRDGRRARLEETEKAREMGYRPRYSWQETQETQNGLLAADVDLDRQSSVRSDVSEDSVLYGSTPGPQIRKSVLRSVSIRNAAAFRQRNMRQIDEESSNGSATNGQYMESPGNGRQWAKVQYSQRISQMGDI